MTTPDPCLTIGELGDYWTSDAGSSDVERIEAHVFTCAQCAARLADAELLRRRVGDTVRSGAFQAVITDAVLNKLSRDGVRVRTYTLEPGEAVQCAVWADDEILVTRLRGDFTGVSSVSTVMRLENGDELDRVVDVPVRDGSTELLLALSADGVRRGPDAPMHLTVTRGANPLAGDVIGEYVFDHRGSHDRSATH
jgi:hypothetical protein